MSVTEPPIGIHSFAYGIGSYQTSLYTTVSWDQLQTLISGLTFTRLLSAAAILYVCGAASVVFYRLFLHPISRFPGPRIAAATHWYQAYYDIWKGGKMTQNIGRLHEIYGPIVRIGPNKLHFGDPEEYSKIYSVNTKFIKDPSLYTTFDVDQSSFGYTDPHASRGRRVVLSPLFSRRAIIDLQWLVVDKFDKLCEKLVEYGGPDKPVNLLYAFRSTTLDIVSAFSFGESFDSLDAKDFRSPLLMAMETAAGTFRFSKHFPFLNRMLINSPSFIVALLSSSKSALSEVKKTMEIQIDKILENPEELKKSPHPIIYSRLLDLNARGADAAPPTRRSLQDEAQIMLFAGSDTVALTLTTGFFHIMDNPAVYQKLMAELTQAWPNLGTAPGYEDLEKLPYLTAVIKESLRLGNGVVSPLARRTPSSGAVISGEFIPGGTTVMMSAPVVHSNEEKFPNNQNFIPERWQQADSKHLENYLVAFSKGTRQCLGINLAYVELYIGFASIFRRFEIKLDNKREDLDWQDFFVTRFTGKNIQGIVTLRTS